MVFALMVQLCLLDSNWAKLRAKPEHCECAAGSAWFMTPTGELT